MNKKISPLCLFLVLAALSWICSGCAASAEIAPTQTHITPQTTATATLPPQDTPTPAFSFHTDLACWQMRPLQPGNDIKGSLILSSGNQDFYWDVSSFHGKFITNKARYGLGFSPSPDGSFIPVDMPVDELDDHTMILMFPDKQPVTLDIPMGENSYGLTYLFNGEILAERYADLASNPIDNKNYQQGVGYTVVYYIYDPKTGNLESHSVLLPNFEFLYYGGVHLAYIDYSPDGKYVVYRSSLPGQEEKRGFSLLDLQSNQIKWTVPEEANKVTGIGESRYRMPVWKPDGSSLTYIWNSDDEDKAQNYYNISLDGTITQFTRFEDILPHGYILYSQPKWSPDMRYLAFQIEEFDHPREPELFIWDDANKILLNPCLPVSGMNYIHWYSWSFDSKHIVLGFNSLLTPAPSGQTYSSRNFILDIPNKVTYELPGAQDMREYLKLSGNDYRYGAGYWLNWELP